MTPVVTLLALHGSDLLAIAAVVLLWVLLSALRRRLVRRNRRDRTRG